MIYDNYDDLPDLDEMLGGSAGPEEDPQRRCEIRYRVVLLPEAPRLDADAELDRVMPRILSDVVERVNAALEETLLA